MKLRNLKSTDAPLMLEWMHDETVVGHLATAFAEKTICDCEAFIEHSHTDKQNLHFAIVNDADEYMGTVSLKHLDPVHRRAEFAITVRSCAMGKGYSQYAMAAILEKGLQELGLLAIYWCVDRQNTRAIRFYDKNGYLRTKQVPESICRHYSSQQQETLLWYVFQ